jgi:hypothetical protein
MDVYVTSESSPRVFESKGAVEAVLAKEGYALSTNLSTMETLQFWGPERRSLYARRVPLLTHPDFDAMRSKHVPSKRL